MQGQGHASPPGLKQPARLCLAPEKTQDSDRLSLVRGSLVYE